MISLHLLDEAYPFEGFDHLRPIARGVVMNREGKIALHLLHRNDDFGDQVYFELPGGGVDEDETFHEAVIRECKEELGADIQVLSLVAEIEDAYNKIKRKNLNRYFLCRVLHMGKKRYRSRGDRLIQETRWVDLEEAIALLEKQDDTLVSGLVKRRELPVLEEVKRLRDAHRISWPYQPRHHGTRKFETKHLVLRRFAIEDAEPMYRNWAGDPEVAEFLEWPMHANADVTKSVVAYWVNKYVDPTFYQWVIVSKEIDEPIGSISVIHSDYNALELGFCLGKAYWHKGYAREALKCLLAYFFEEVGVRRVFAKTDVNNERASKTMIAAGMKIAKTIPNGGFNQRGVCDVRLHEIRLEDYLARKIVIW